MATSMLEYSKLILEKVSFDSHLFQKELLKAVKVLKADETEEILLWCVNCFRKPVV
jgi:hypothetical protein